MSRFTVWRLSIIGVLLVVGGFAALLIIRPWAISPSAGQIGATLFAVGDLAGRSDNDSQVVAMMSGHKVDAFLPLGDNAYVDGTLEQYEEFYAPTFGVYDPIAFPIPGNHDYADDGTADGYFSYFGERALNFPDGAPYYAFELGGWSMYALNSEIDSEPGSAMYVWLAERLANDDADCIAGLWHQPAYSIGRHEGSREMRSLMELLGRYGGDLALVSHDHNYQRWEPIDGVRQFVVGTGGGTPYAFESSDDRVAAAHSGVLGALQMALTPAGATYQFITTANGVLDEGSFECSPAG